MSTTGQALLIEIPNWHPAPLNQLLGGHWARAARRKKTDRRMIEAYCYLAQVPRATGKRRLSLTIVLAPGQRACDPDAYHKALLDGLVHCGALRNDSHRWVELAPVQFERGKNKTTRIVLEDV